MNYNNVGIMDKNKIVDMPLFVIPTCTGRRVGRSYIINDVFDIELICCRITINTSGCPLSN